MTRSWRGDRRRRLGRRGVGDAGMSEWVVARALVCRGVVVGVGRLVVGNTAGVVGAMVAGHAGGRIAGLREEIRGALQP